MEGTADAGKMQPSKAFVAIASLVQLFCFIGFCALTSPSTTHYKHYAQDLQLYNLYLAVTVMMFVGFGYLMTFMRMYGLGAVGLTMFITCLGMQLTMLFDPLFANGWSEKVEISTYTLLTGNFGVATFLISFGGLIGKVNPTQIVVLLVFETLAYCMNTQMLMVKWLAIADVGGSIAIHMFGAYFGLAVASVVGKPADMDGAEPNMNSNIFSLIGTTFLWIYWPSFVGALVEPGSLESDLAITNTVLALLGSTVSTFILSAALAGKYVRPVDIQNATLAGGVSIGAVANLNIHPWGAVVIGCLAGIVSTLGYNIIQPWLETRFELHDTCGINNLHGMPSIVGGFASVLVPIMTTQGNAGAFGRPTDQLIGIIVTLFIAGVTGTATGHVMRFFRDGADIVTDALIWEVTEDYLVKTA